MVRLPPRLVGVALLLASAGSTLAHRAVYDAARARPAGLAKFALGLTTFLLASTGVLLLIHGRRLFEQSGRGPQMRRTDRTTTAPLCRCRKPISKPYAPAHRCGVERNDARP
ncbi:hypothetical protein ACBY01_05170 [Sphingomonas sp. ac-8]|uniref:hypothetical protein n=1 Tax=Sphingomonas sp. ac-8 TaxID=3242977 RepID=UPI003A80888D